MLDERAAKVQARIEAAALRASRNPNEVRILAVTKTRTRETVSEAIGAGILLFGENRVQEAQAKFLPVDERVELHLVGHLQRNKAKLVPGLFSWVESIDRMEIATAIDAHWPTGAVPCQVLLQFNSSGEATKSGFRSGEELIDAIGSVAELPNLSVRGVMTIGPLSSDESEIRAAFSKTRRLFDSAKSTYADLPIDTLSMGMSDDYEIAVEEGATEVRLGSILFGPRVS